MKNIEISDKNYERLGGHAKVFETPDGVISRLLDYFEQGSTGMTESKQSIPSLTQSRSYSKYLFEEELYGKGRLVLAVMKSYCNKHQEISIDELKEIFPDHLQGSIGVFSPVSRAIKIRDNGPRKQKRHFIKPEEIISISDGDIAVCTEWGAGNIDNFIEQSKKQDFNIEIQQ